MQPELRYGVMVALGILVPSVQVRILVSQHKHWAGRKTGFFIWNRGRESLLSTVPVPNEKPDVRITAEHCLSVPPRQRKKDVRTMWANPETVKDCFQTVPVLFENRCSQNSRALFISAPAAAEKGCATQTSFIICWYTECYPESHASIAACDSG